MWRLGLLLRGGVVEVRGTWCEGVRVVRGREGVVGGVEVGCGAWVLTSWRGHCVLCRVAVLSGGARCKSGWDR